jgi:hypothetical protein
MRYVPLLLVLSAVAMTSFSYGHESTRHAYESALSGSAGSSVELPCAMAEVDGCETTLSLVDSVTEQCVPGLVRIRARSGCQVPLDHLLLMICWNTKRAPSLTLLRALWVLQHPAATNGAPNVSEGAGFSPKRQRGGTFRSRRPTERNAVRPDVRRLV